MWQRFPLGSGVLAPLDDTPVLLLGEKDSASFKIFDSSDTNYDCQETSNTTHPPKVSNCAF